MIRGNSNGFMLLVVQYHPRTQQGDQRPAVPETRGAGTGCRRFPELWVWGILHIVKCCLRKSSTSYVENSATNTALFPMSPNSPVTKLSCPEEWFPLSCIVLCCYVLLEKLREGVSALVFCTQESMFLKSATLPTLRLFALWSGLRAHKVDCFQIKLNQKTCFWTVPNVLQPLTALVTSSIPLHPPAPNSVDIGSSVPTVSLHRSTPIAWPYLPVWVGIHSDTPARLTLIYASADLVSNMGSLLLPIQLEHVSWHIFSLAGCNLQNL